MQKRKMEMKRCKKKDGKRFNTRMHIKNGVLNNLYMCACICYMYHNFVENDEYSTLRLQEWNKQTVYKHIAIYIRIYICIHICMEHLVCMYVCNVKEWILCCLEDAIHYQKLKSLYVILEYIFCTCFYRDIDFHRQNIWRSEQGWSSALKKLKLTLP